MRYIKAFDIWKVETAIRNGSFKIQSGQPIYCGDDEILSIFDSVNLKTGHIRAYHGATYQEALKKYRSVKRMEKMTPKERKEYIKSLKG